MKGEQDMVDAIQKKSEYLEASPGSFFGAKPWKRIIVAFAGPLVNLLFAIITITTIWFIGFSYESPDNRIILAADYASPTVSDNASIASLDTQASPAAKAGLKSGDRIIAINGKTVINWTDIKQNTAISARQELVFLVERDGNQFSTKLTPLMDTESGGGFIGIMSWQEPIIKRAESAAAAGGLLENDRILAINGQTINLSAEVQKIVSGAQGQLVVLVERAGSQLTLNFSPDYSPSKVPYLAVAYKGLIYHSPKMNLLEAAAHGYSESIKTIGLTIRGIGLMFQGLNPVKAIQGPKRIVEMIGTGTVAGFSQSIGDGLRYFFNVLAFISIALFFGNLLPIPALDGGQILLFSWEAIRGKPLKLRFVQRYQVVGAILVIALLLLAIYGDILSVFGK